MAAFRAITAEEEAASAILLLLREKRYPGARGLSFRDHVTKQAVFPFVSEVGEVLLPIWKLFSPRLHIDELPDGGHQLDVIYSFEGQDFRHDPPLGHMMEFDPVTDLSSDEMLRLPDLLTEIDVTVAEQAAHGWVTPEKVRAGTENLAQLLAGRLSAKSNRAGFRSFRRRVQEHANERNRLLYAGPKGWPGAVKDVDIVIRDRKRRAVILLEIYSLLFPHQTRAVLVEQVVITFASVVVELRSQESNSPRSPVKPAYVGLVRKDPDSDFGVEFPDFPGCITAGKDLEEARALAEEALRFHIEGMIEDGEPLPRPSRFEEIMSDPANRGSVALLVDASEGQTWKSS